MAQATYRVEMEDGRVFDVEVEGDEPPTEQEILAHLAETADAPKADPSVLSRLQQSVAPVASHGDSPQSWLQRLADASNRAEQGHAAAKTFDPQVAKDEGIGLAKGAANTAIGLGSTANWMMGSPTPPETFGAARTALATPDNDVQRLFFGLEQGAEFLALPQVKGNLLARMATEGGQQGLLARTQGNSPTAAVVGGAAAPVVGSASRVFGAAAPRLVRSAIKPTVTEMRRVAGASRTGINAQANRLVDFILDHKIASADDAQRIIDDAEREIQRLVAGARGVATDAPQRAERYLKALERSAARQGLPADDVAAIRSKARELLEQSPLAEDVTTTVMKDSPSGLVDSTGRPVQVPVEETSRALRTDVDAAEALEIARNSGRWGNRKAWGEQKGAAREASKAVERANRDAVKATVDETRAPLRRQGQAIQSKNVFDRMAFREGNREPVSPFDVTTAAVEVAHGNVPVLSLARAWLRENKLKAGIWAKRMEEALEKNDAQAAAVILSRFGVGMGQAMRPVPAH